MSLELVPMTLKEANAYVEQNHLEMKILGLTVIGGVIYKNPEEICR